MNKAIESFLFFPCFNCLIRSSNVIELGLCQYDLSAMDLINKQKIIRKIRDWYRIKTITNVNSAIIRPLQWIVFFYRFRFFFLYENCWKKWFPYLNPVTSFPTKLLIMPYLIWKRRHIKKNWIKRTAASVLFLRFLGYICFVLCESRLNTTASN